MKNNRGFIQILAIAAVAVVIVAGIYILLTHDIPTPNPEEPEQTLGSRKPIPTPAPEENPTPRPTETLSKIISTHQGSLTLSYKDGITTLSGTLTRATPCVEWKINVSSTKDLPPSQVSFSVVNASTAEMCIQTLGKPQDVSASSPAGPNTYYNVKLEENIIVFSGKLEK